jgi:MFS family permease
MRAIAAAPYRAALREPRFRRLLPGFVISSLGDGMSIVAVAWLALELAPARIEELVVGAAVAAYVTPGVIGGLVLERYLRNVEAKRLLIADCVLRSVCIGSIPVLFVAGWLTPASFIALLALSSVLHAWGIGGRTALVAELLAPDDRLAANALLGVVSQSTLIVGPALAGILTGSVGAHWVLGADAATYLVLGAMLWTTSIPRTGEARATPSGSATRLLLGHRGLRSLLALTVVFYLLYGPLEVALPVRVARELGRSASFLGFVLTGFGVGALIGGLLAGSVRRLPLRATALAIVAGWGAVVIPPGLIDHPAVLFVCFALGGLIYAPYEAVTATMLQQEVPPERLAAVAAAWRSSLIAATPAGTILGGPLVAALGARTTFLVSGLATVTLAAGVGLRWRAKA